MGFPLQVGVAPSPGSYVSPKDGGDHLQPFFDALTEAEIASKRLRRRRAAYTREAASVAALLSGTRPDATLLLQECTEALQTAEWFMSQTMALCDDILAQVQRQSLVPQPAVNEAAYEPAL